MGIHRFASALRRQCKNFFKAIKKTFGVKSVQIITHGYVDICNDYDQDPETTKKSIYQKIQGYHWVLYLTIT